MNYTNLQELKNRVLIILGFLIISFCVFYVWGSTKTIDLIINFTNSLANELNQPSFSFIYNSLPEAFFIKIKVSLWGALAISIPFIEYQLYRFLSPGLYSHEKKWLYGFLLSFPIFFVAGFYFLFFFVLPNAIVFFLNVANNVGQSSIRLLANLENTIDLFTIFILVFGLSFQLPLLLIFLSKVGFTSIDSLKKHRKYVIVFIFTLAAFLTPPDLISQVALAIPLVLLYEGTILFLWLTTKRKK
ncbi:MAG: twin-arginine translocase subunit TatC [Rickettsiales bacterium]|nr:twin-arginine translocase subunit TatC [Rickettsiales bacterium]|tara:strand:+ start:43851 stop:44582 length:732 start_codon:yes stop_codon:yes gene_type:complete